MQQLLGTAHQLVFRVLIPNTSDARVKGQRGSSKPALRVDILQRGSSSPAFRVDILQRGSSRPAFRVDIQGSRPAGEIPLNLSLKTAENNWF